MAVVMQDTDEGMTVLPMHLSGVKSDENVGGNCVYSPQSFRPPKCKSFGLETFPGAYACCNFAESCRHGDKRGDCVLHSCFAPRKRLYRVDFSEKMAEKQGEHVCVILCVFSLLFSGFFLRKR